MQAFALNVQCTALWHSYCYNPGNKQILRCTYQKGFPMYLLFVPPVVSFVAIFTLSIHNQFATQTNL